MIKRRKEQEVCCNDNTWAEAEAEAEAKSEAQSNRFDLFAYDSCKK